MSDSNISHRFSTSLRNDKSKTDIILKLLANYSLTGGLRFWKIQHLSRYKSALDKSDDLLY